MSELSAKMRDHACLSRVHVSCAGAVSLGERWRAHTQHRCEARSCRLTPHKVNVQNLLQLLHLLLSSIKRLIVFLEILF